MSHATIGAASALVESGGEERIGRMKCPFCAEEIQNDAKKCRYCGEFLAERSEAWEYQTFRFDLRTRFVDLGRYPVSMDTTMFEAQTFFWQSGLNDVIMRDVGERSRQGWQVVPGTLGPTSIAAEVKQASCLTWVILLPINIIPLLGQIVFLRAVEAKYVPYAVNLQMRRPAPAPP